jgi:selenocysteine lyase/cysteine desulfurase
LVKHFVNGGGSEGARVGQGLGEVIFGASSTEVCNRIANAYAEAKAAGGLGGRNEIIVGTFGHEGNIGCWMKLAQRGFTIREWPCDIDADGTPRPSVATLQSLLNEKTLLVAFAQVSNILGEVYDVRAITTMCHAAGAKVMVDGVAYAPHHAPDVAAWGCDWYVYSTYKVFGPHMGAMFGRHEAFAGLTGPNHGFIARDVMPGKWEPGGSNHEGCAMVNALWPYVTFVAGADASAPINHAVFHAAFSRMAELEDGLMRKVISFLSEYKDVRVIGPKTVDEKRVCIAAFVREGVSSASIAKALNAKGFGVRYGNFYSRRLCEQLRIDPSDGVVRISLAHYNSEEELDMLLKELGEVME